MGSHLAMGGVAVDVKRLCFFCVVSCNKVNVIAKFGYECSLDLIYLIVLDTFLNCVYFSLKLVDLH